MLGPGVFAAQVERFEGATFVESLDRGPRVGLAEWLAGVLIETPSPRAVIGHGLGAVAALQLATARPDLIHGLMLIGIGTKARVPPRGGLVDSIVDASFADPTSATAQATRDALSEVDAAILEEAVHAWAALELEGRLEAVGQPTLLVAAGQDQLAPLDGAEALAGERARAGLAVLPSVGHAAPVEAPGAIDLLAAAFLARLELTLLGES
jgi:pimeloyl-ACP methyl ester carboxylesterase